MPNTAIGVNSLPTKLSQFLIRAIGLIIVDIFVYGWVVPFLAVLLTSWITQQFHFSPRVEIIFMVVTVVASMIAVLNFKFEQKFWKHFFAHERPYMLLLLIREVINIILLGFAVNDLIGIIRSIGNDHGLKRVYLTEGAKYVFFHNFIVDYGDEQFLKENWRQCATAKDHAEVAPVNPQPPPVETCALTYFESAMVWLENVWLKGFLNAHDTPVNRDSERCLEFARFLHAAELSLTLAYIIAHVGKVLYFSTLNAYSRSMEIFVSMHSNSTFPISYHNSAYSSEASTNNLYESFAGSEEDSEDDEEDDDEEEEEEEFASLLVDRATSFSMAHLPPTRQLLYGTRRPEAPSTRRFERRPPPPTPRPQLQSSLPPPPQRPQPRRRSPPLPQTPSLQSSLPPPRQRLQPSSRSTWERPQSRQRSPSPPQTSLPPPPQTPQPRSAPTSPPQTPQRRPRSPPSPQKPPLQSALQASQQKPQPRPDSTAPPQRPPLESALPASLQTPQPRPDSTVPPQTPPLQASLPAPPQTPPLQSALPAPSQTPPLQSALPASPQKPPLQSALPASQQKPQPRPDSSSPPQGPPLESALPSSARPSPQRPGSRTTASPTNQSIYEAAVAEGFYDRHRK